MNALLLFHLAYIYTLPTCHTETFKIYMFHCFKRETRSVASVTQDKAMALFWNLLGAVFGNVLR